MITKQRLEELIEQEATIYQVYADVTVIKMKLDKDFKVDDAHLWKKLKGAVKSCGYPLYKLFEIKEEAEWYKEFGNITRTEHLKLPTWEELKNILQTQKYFEVNFKNKYETVSFCVNECQIAVVQQGHNYLSGLDKEFNKENYILACRKAKELFLLGNN